jgi:hypothetical protein
MRIRYHEKAPYYERMCLFRSSPKKNYPELKPSFNLVYIIAFSR